MEKEDFKNLEELLGKLSIDLGYRFCIIPQDIQDLTYIAIYNHDGKLLKQTYGLDIEDCVKKLSTKQS